MKKVIFFLAAIFIVLFTVVINLLETSNNQKQDNAVEKKKDDVIKLKFAHHMPENTVVNQAALRFAQEINKKTKGKVEITVYPSQELGNSHQMLELSRLGQIDILLTATAKVSVASPSMQYADLPFLFPTKEDAYVLLDGKVGNMLFRDLSQVDLFGVAFWDGGFKNFTSNKPLTKLEDFKDLKVRVMKSRIIMEQYYALNAKPITIDFHETKKALQDGVVDAQENPLSEIVSMGFHKLQSDITLSKHSYLPYVLTFSTKSISKLPLDIQNILIQTAKEITSWEREEIAKKEKNLLEDIKKASVKIHTLSSSERKRLQKATAYIAKSYENVIGSHIISKTQEYFYKKNKKDNMVVIGVDADLSMGAKGGGLAIKRGVELAVDNINQNGGLLGKKVLVVAKDHQGISTQADQNIKEFIDDNNTIAVIGGKHSAIISSYTKEIQDNKLIYFSPWAAAATVTENGYDENYIFRVSLNDKYAARFLAQNALKKSSNPLVVVENSVWGKEALNNINLYLSSKGLKQQNGIIINRGETNFEKVFETMQNKFHDSIIMVLNSQEGTKLVEYMGKNAIHIPVISHWGIVGDSFFKVNQTYLKDIDLIFIQTVSLINNNKKQMQNLVKDYLKAYAKSSTKQINAITGVVQAYDSVMLLAHAIKKCKSFDAVKIKLSLESIDSYDGVLKMYKRPFKKTNHDALNIEDFFMAKFDKDGNILPTRD
ncbi:DctP family TRAP transporter solute-binding subunit [Sulfurimonas sp.]|uniref:DctP family TRAP transporter solute-binding subunit n=1 Tax=Sulfurimonas sp. TaxID=2022749 RepID=UPI00356762AC